MLVLLVNCLSDAVLPLVVLRPGVTANNGEATLTALKHVGGIAKLSKPWRL
jgi:hypothetical protein